MAEFITREDLYCQERVPIPSGGYEACLTPALPIRLATGEIGVLCVAHHLAALYTMAETEAMTAEYIAGEGAERAQDIERLLEAHNGDLGLRLDQKDAEIERLRAEVAAAKRLTSEVRLWEPCGHYGRHDEAECEVCSNFRARGRLAIELDAARAEIQDLRGARA